MHHKAWEAERLRALNEMLSVELQPEELLLEAVEVPWRGESGEESSGEEMEAGSSLQPGGLAPKRMRVGANGQDGRGKQQQKRGRRRHRGAGGQRQGSGKWSMPGFSADPGSAVMVAGNYVVKAVQTHVIRQGTVGKEVWLGVDLRRGGVSLTDWMQSGELQRGVAGDGGWLARLRGKTKEGWSVEGHNWVYRGMGRKMTYLLVKKRLDQNN